VATVNTKDIIHMGTEFSHWLYPFSIMRMALVPHPDIKKCVSQYVR